MGRVSGKVAVISGAARGQGRSHALKLAGEGAEIIALDICADIASNAYALATPADLADTARDIEALGQRVEAIQVDVRDRAAVDEALGKAIGTFGRLDVVVANAGICPLGDQRPQDAFVDAVDVDLGGVLNLIHSSLRYLQSGASIIATGSLAAFLRGSVDNPATGPGGAGYSFSKRIVAEYIHELALQLAPVNIRANAVHPTNCNTPMLQSDVMYRVFRPDVEQPSRADAEAAFPAMNAMPVGFVEPDDISNAVLFLASDESRYVTGLQLRVDAGGFVKANPFHA